MIRCEVVNEDFTLQRFNELKNIKRKSREEKGKLFKGDTFECSEELVNYLTGNNPLKKVVVKVIEILPKTQILSQSPIEELEKASKVESVTTTCEFKAEKEKTKKKKTSKK